MRLLTLLTMFSFSLSHAQSKTATDYATSITAKELMENLYVYSSDYFGGREAGTKVKISLLIFKDYYVRQNIPPAEGSEDYFQEMRLNHKGVSLESKNVVAIVKGSVYPEEYIILSAHLDHIGTHDGEINNGADDDGSGNVTPYGNCRSLKNGC